MLFVFDVCSIQANMDFLAAACQSWTSHKAVSKDRQAGSYLELADVLLCQDVQSRFSLLQSWQGLFKLSCHLGCNDVCILRLLGNLGGLSMHLSRVM